MDENWIKMCKNEAILRAEYGRQNDSKINGKINGKIEYGWR